MILRPALGSHFGLLALPVIFRLGECVGVSSLISMPEAGAKEYPEARIRNFRWEHVNK